MDPSESPLLQLPYARNVRSRTSLVYPFAHLDRLLATQEGVDAGTTVACFWRRYRRYTTYRLFSNLVAHEVGTHEAIQAKEFDQLVPFLTTERVKDLTMQCLRRLHMTCIARHRDRVYPNPENVFNVRVFLASYLVVFHPSKSFEDLPAARKLFDTAFAMVNAFLGFGQAILSSSTKAVSECLTSCTETFPLLLDEYRRLFNDWKKVDAVKLVTRMEKALFALYTSESIIVERGEGDQAESLGQIRATIKALSRKMDTVGGPGTLARFHLTPPGTRRSGPAAGEAGEASVPDVPLARSSRLTLPSAIHIVTSTRLTNEQIAHELLLNPLFQFQRTGNDGSADASTNEICNVFHRAFWDSVKGDLGLAVPCYIRVLQVLDSLRGTMEKLIPPSTVPDLVNLLDTDSIRHQIASGAFGRVECEQLLVAVFGIFVTALSPSERVPPCACWDALRDTLRAADAEKFPSAICDMLEFLCSSTGVVAIDKANVRLRHIAPFIRDHGVDYEREKFAEKVQEGMVSLDCTKAWLSASVQREVGGSTGMSRVDLVERDERHVLHVQRAAMLNLVMSPVAGGFKSTIPETLSFDVERLDSLHTEFTYLALALPMMASAEYALASARVSASVKDKAMAVFVKGGAVGATPDRMVRDLRTVLELESVAAETVTAACGIALRGASSSDRVNAIIVSRFRAGCMEELVQRTGSNAKLQAMGVPIYARIRAAVDLLEMVSRLNFRVHQARYVDMVAAIAREEM